MATYPNTESLSITDSAKWLLSQEDTERVLFAIDATNGAALVEGCIVALNDDGNGVAWGTQTVEGTYDYEPYGILMSEADVSTATATLSVLTKGMVDERRITCIVDGAEDTTIVADAIATLRKNNIIVKECE